MPDNSDDIDNIIDALKEKNIEVKKEFRKAATKDNLEEYVIESASTVINEGLDLVKNLNVYLNAAPDAKDLSAYAELLNATSTAIETLNKIIVQDKKSNTLKDLKKMDHEIKKDLIGEAKDMLVGTREDMFKKLVKEADVIDISSNESVCQTIERTETTATTSQNTLSSTAN
jgi:hypothetical protein